jgi:hypothetical protein
VRCECGKSFCSTQQHVFLKLYTQQHVFGNCALQKTQLRIYVSSAPATEDIFFILTTAAISILVRGKVGETSLVRVSEMYFLII